MIYKLTKKSVPDLVGGGRKKKYYATPVTMGRSTLSMVIDSITQFCTVSSPDIKAVVDAFVIDVKNRLMQGQIVEFGDIGHFRLSIANFGGTATKAAWTPMLIKKAKIVFTPSTQLKRAADEATFERWAGDTNEETTNP